MVFVEMLICLVFFIAGFGLALVSKGINININQGIPNQKIDYNESTVEHLDPEVRLYYDKTNGINKF